MATTMIREINFLLNSYDQFYDHDNVNWDAAVNQNTGSLGDFEGAVVAV